MNKKLRLINFNQDEILSIGFILAGVLISIFPAAILIGGLLWWSVLSLIFLCLIVISWYLFIDEPLVWYPKIPFTEAKVIIGETYKNSGTYYVDGDFWVGEKPERFLLTLDQDEAYEAYDKLVDEYCK